MNMQRDRIAPSELSGWVTATLAHPKGSGAVTRWRRAVRLGLARETTRCPGCDQHNTGDTARTFVWMGDVWIDGTPMSDALKVLQARRGALIRDLAEVDREIAEIQGSREIGDEPAILLIGLQQAQWAR